MEKVHFLTHICPLATSLFGTKIYLCYFTSTDQTLWVSQLTPPPSLPLRPTPRPSPQFLFLSHPPPSPPSPSPTLQMLPILDPPFLLSTIPPFSPPPPRSPPPPPPLPRCSRPPSPSPPRLLLTPPRRSHSCPPPPPLPTPITPSQRRSARIHPQTPLFLPRLPHVSQICRTKYRLILCSLNLVSCCRVNLSPAEVICLVIKAQQHLSIQISLLQILFRLPTTTTTLQLPVCSAPYPLMVPRYLSPSPLSLHTCKICPFQMCLPALPTLPFTSKIWATKPKLPPSLLPSLPPPSLIHLPPFLTPLSNPPPAWLSPLLTSSPPSLLPHCHQHPTLKTFPIRPLPPPPPHTLRLK